MLTFKARYQFLLRKLLVFGCGRRTRGRARSARATLVGELLALVVGIGARQALIASGTFFISTINLTLAPPANIWNNTQRLILGLYEVFHNHIYYLDSNPNHVVFVWSHPIAGSILDVVVSPTAAVDRRIR